jgi:uncharacterized protein YjaG (DUF416 family)
VLEENLLEQLEPWQQLAISAVAVRRMYPNYALFCELTEFADAKKFQSILALVWEFVSGINEDVDFDKQQVKLDLITPEATDYDMYGVWPALDAVTGLSLLIGACKYWHSDEVKSVFKLSHSTVEAYIELLEEEGLDHPLHQFNFTFIQEAVDLLLSAHADQGRKQAVKQLRQMADKIEVSNIGLTV